MPSGDFGVVVAPEPFVGDVGHDRGTGGARGRHVADRPDDCWCQVLMKMRCSGAVVACA